MTALRSGMSVGLMGIAWWEWLAMQWQREKHRRMKTWTRRRRDRESNGRRCRFRIAVVRDREIRGRGFVRQDTTRSRCKRTKWSFGRCDDVDLDIGRVGTIECRRCFRRRRDGERVDSKFLFFGETMH